MPLPFVCLAKICLSGATLLGAFSTNEPYALLKDVFDAVATGGEAVGELGGPGIVTLRKAMEGSRSLVEKAYQDALNGTHSAGFAETVEAAFANLGEVFERCLPSGQELVALRHDPEAIGRHVADAAVALDMDVFRAGEGRRLLIVLVTLAYTSLDRDPAFMDALQRLNWKDALQQLDAIKAELSAFQVIIDRLTRDLVITQSDKEKLAVEAATAREKLGSTVALITGFLQVIIGREIPSDQIPATLMQAAANWRSTGKRIDALDHSRNLNPEIDRLRDRAKSAFAEENVVEVERLLREIEQVEESALERLQRHQNEVQAEMALRRAGLIETKTARLDLARSQLNHAEAASLIWQLVQMSVPDPAERFEALRRERYKYYVGGRDGGLNTSLTLAIELAQICLKAADSSDERGTAGNDLGVAITALGEREAGTAPLEQAVETFRAALEEFTRERVPLDWAMTQNNLGAALSILGAREAGTARLELAVEAYRAALEERTRERVPLDWAMTQNNLGNVLRTLGAREAGTERLQQAVEAYRAALEEFTRERVPLDWAVTQNNLGNALQTLGAREPRMERLQEAVKAYRAALEEFTRERVPLRWAMTQNNLGNALQALGAREAGTALLEQAVEAHRAAQEEATRERVPLQWATTQNNLGNALQAIGAREAGTARLQEAAEAYRAALEERTRERVPLQWEQTTKALEAVLAEIDRRQAGGA